MNFNNSNILFEKSQKIIPGGVNSPVRAFKSVGRYPAYIKKANGAYIFDEDNNKYIDYVCSWGPSILGHAHPQVIEKVKQACNDGLTFGAPTAKEYELAKLINEAMPAVEMVRLVNSGTEAVMSAIRVARGFTKRDKIIKFKGNYHGHSDGLLVKAGSGLLTESIPDSAGVPAGYAENTLVAEYNNPESVKLLFENNPDNIACLIVEPVAANIGVVPPCEGFLKFLHDITKEYGSLLIFDEVITGFRLSYGGACEYYGITPDIVTLGKIVGGGMPLAAYGGRKEIMQVIAPIGSVYQAGTLSGNPIAVTAGIETLKILRDNKNIYKNIDEKAAKIEQALIQIGASVNRVSSLISGFFTDRKVIDFETAMSSDTNKYSKYFSHMFNNGIYIAPSQFESMFLSKSHSDEDIEKTCEIIKQFTNN